MPSVPTVNGSYVQHLAECDTPMRLYLDDKLAITADSIELSADQVQVHCCFCIALFDIGVHKLEQIC